MAQVEEKKFIENEDATPDFVKCPGCGANLEFDPESQKLRCVHCNTEVDFEKSKEYKEISLERAFDSANQVDEQSKLYRCSNCGAEVVIDANDVATECPFCGTPYVVKSESLNGLKPNAVYPFMIDKSQAKGFISKRVRKNLFCPTKFKKNIDVKAINGVYYPCFTFDSNTFSTYVGKVGDRHTRTVKTSSGTRTETYYTYRIVSGTISLLYDDITITASKKINQKTLDKIMPYNINNICVYERKFLSGYCASHYDTDIKTCWGQAKSIMEARIRQAVIKKCHCDTVVYLNISTTHNDVTYKYVLMPIYLCNLKYRKKEYPLKMNGTNGKITGKLPVSKLRVFFATLLGIAVVGVVGYFIYKYLL